MMEKKRSERLLEDLSYDRGDNIEMNTRQMSMRFIWHLLRLKAEIVNSNDMNFDVGYSCIDCIARKKGVPVPDYYGKMYGILEDTVMPVIDELIESSRVALGYTKEDMRSLFEELI